MTARANVPTRTSSRGRSGLVRCIAGLVVAGVLAAGCSNTGTAAPSSTTLPLATISPQPPTSSGSATSIRSVESSTVGSSSGSAASSTSAVESSSAVTSSAVTSSAVLTAEEQEAVDRAAIEETWRRFWPIYTGIVRTPEQDRKALLETVAVDPISTKILEGAKKLIAEGLDHSGSPILNPFWKESVAGQGIAVMRDCQDQRGYSAVFVATGEKRSSGTDRYHIKAEFSRDVYGDWRVRSITHIEDTPC